MALKLSVAARNAILDALNTTIGASAQIKIYAGTRPASVATAIGAQTLLGTLTGDSSAFAASAADGVLTANTITQDSAADASGTASFFRIFKSNGTTAVIDGDCGTSGSDMNLNTTTIVVGGPIQITSCTLTAPGA